MAAPISPARLLRWPRPSASTYSTPPSKPTEQRHVRSLRLKRDYASTVIIPDADTIMALLPKWIDDYCEVHPHLKFRSPREFLRLSA